MDAEIRRELGRVRQLELAALAQQELLVAGASRPKRGFRIWPRRREDVIAGQDGGVDLRVHAKGAS